MGQKVNILVSGEAPGAADGVGVDHDEICSIRYFIKLGIGLLLGCIGIEAMQIQNQWVAGTRFVTFGQVYNVVAVFALIKNGIFLAKKGGAIQPSHQKE